MTLSVFFLIFSIGFISLSYQTLLFRDFISNFDSNALSIGCFFGSWLFWISIGAIIGKPDFVTRRLKKSLFYILLLYIPVFILQKYTIIFSGRILNLQIYDVLPYFKVITFSFVSNIGISILTGLLFTLCCKYLASDQTNIAKIYLTECLGSFLGGIFVTVALYFLKSSEIIFLILSFMVIFSVVIKLIEERQFIRSFVVLLLIPLALFYKIDSKWSDQLNSIEWEKLFPQSNYKNIIITEQNKYLTGFYKNQYNIVCNHEVIDYLPAADSSKEITALNISQNIDAKNILVVGDELLGIASGLLTFEHIQNIYLYNSDTKYLSKIMEDIPYEYQLKDNRIKIINSDIRNFLKTHPDFFDVVILNMPSPSNSRLNRYFTREFYEMISDSLTVSGIVSVKFKGGENYIGTELTRLGASVYFTLKGIFKYIILKPGSESWFISSNKDVLTDNPETLIERINTLMHSDLNQDISDAKERERKERAAANFKDMYPLENIKTLFVRNRIDYQLKNYESFKNEIAINTDLKPHTYLLSLLAASKTNSELALKIFNILSYYSAKTFILILLVFGFFRFLYLTKIKNNLNLYNSFESYLLIFISGFLSISLQIILMFLFQTLYGTLFLYVGIISSLFMLGMYVGGMIVNKTINTGKINRLVLFFIIFFNILFILFIKTFGLQFDIMHFIFNFFLSGFISGTYFPLASKRLSLLDYKNVIIGSNLESLDHFGAAVGAIFTGIFFIPAMGIIDTSNLLVFLLLFILILETVNKEYNSNLANSKFHYFCKMYGYILFGFLIFFVLLKSHISSPFEEQIKFNAEHEKSDKSSHIINSKDWADSYTGYNGPIEIEMEVSDNGVLMNYTILKNHETSVYLDYIKPWKKSLIGKNFLNKRDINEIDTVSGATYTSKAILKTISFAIQNYKNRNSKNLQSTLQKEKEIFSGNFLKVNILFLIFLSAAILIHIRNNDNARTVFLILIIGIFGIYLNFQYSPENIFGFLFFKDTSFSNPVILLILFPIVIILTGNIYCGYLCPFGAIQEMIGNLCPASLTPDISKPVWKWLKLTKYLIFFAIAFIYIYNGDAIIFKNDPLTTFFSKLYIYKVIYFSFFIFICSFFYKRFWCRNLCPSGAFLSFFNEISLSKYFLKKPVPAKCDLGVQNQDELDCINCDKCKIKN